MAVKVMRYEITGWNGHPQEAKARWMAIADKCREMANCIWQEWEAWHVQQGSHQKCLEYAEQLRAHRRRETTEKPKLEVVCMSPELSKRIYRVCADRFPSLHARVQVLLTQLVKKRMQGKDVEGRWNIWLAVLLNRQGRPNCTGDQPIPFDRANSSLSFDDDGKLRLDVRLTRLPQDGKSAASIEDHVTLKARGSGAAIAGRVVAGEWKFCGSSIVYQASRRKWYALVCYDMGATEAGELNDSLHAVLLPGKESPWIAWHGGRYYWFGGRGRHVEAARRRLLTGRWSRQEGYRYAGSSNKGHGRKRAMQGVEKLSRAWKDFTKTCNHQVTRDVIRWCQDRGIGRLVYLQPASDRKRTSRFLATAGKLDREDSTAWDWAQIGAMLGYKCKEAGIHLEIRKCDATGRRKEAKKSKKTA